MNDEKQTRRDAMRRLIKQVSVMTPEQKAAVAARLPIVNTEGHALSLFNICFICLQNGRETLPTIVGGFKQWLKQGRCVRKGEHGMSIWFPVRQSPETQAHENEPEAKEIISSFMLGTVFDISQTTELVKESTDANQ